MRLPHPDQTVQTEPANQAGVQILLLALQPALGQELAVRIKIYEDLAAWGPFQGPDPLNLAPQPEGASL